MYARKASHLTIFSFISLCYAHLNKRPTPAFSRWNRRERDKRQSDESNDKAAKSRARFQSACSAWLGGCYCLYTLTQASSNDDIK